MLRARRSSGDSRSISNARSGNVLSDLDVVSDWSVFFDLDVVSDLSVLSEPCVFEMEGPSMESSSSIAQGARAIVMA